MDIIVLIISLVLLYKRKLAWVLFGIIFLTTNYLNAGTGLSEFPFAHNVSDSGLILYLVLSFYLLKKNNYELPKTPFDQKLKYFYYFLLISIIVDIIFNGIDLLSIVKTSRHWIFLSCIWVFYYVSDKDVKKLINYLLYALAIISVIMLIEFFFSIQILGKEIKTEYLTPGVLIERGSIPSNLLLFFLLLLVSRYFKFKPKTKYFYVGIFSAVLITSMIRSYFFAVIIGILLVLYLEKLKVKSILTGITIAAVLILIVYNTPFFKERFISGFEEIQNLNLAYSPQGNLSYRLLHAAERLDYISKKTQYEIFGIGNITEEDFPNTFYIGLRYESGRVMQLVSPDIAWSTFFLRLGFVGTIIYLIFYVSITIKFYRLRLNNPIALITFVYLFINLTMISFVSYDIANGQFWLFPVLLYYAISKKKSNENYDKNI